MKETPRQAIRLMDRLQRHWIVTSLTILGSIASIASAVVFFWPLPPPPPPEAPSSAGSAAPPTSDLTIIDADLEPGTRTRRLFKIIPVGTDYILSYDIAIRNAERRAMTSCRIATEYAGPHVRGSGVLFVGPWVNWYNGKGANIYFDLPEDPAFTSQFFSHPNQDDFWPLDWVRVRVLCQKPNFQISPWYDIDLTRVQWS